MKITVIASGSSGNCYLIKSEKANVLIEAGVNPKLIKKKTGLNFSQITGILISHKHKDHSAYAGKIASDYGVKIYGNADTLESIKEKCINKEVLNPMKSIYLKDLYITPLQLNHDVDCLGFTIVDTKTNEKLLFFTDTGSLNYDLPQFDIVMAECNYSEQILMENVANGRIDRSYAERVRKTHFSIEKLEKFIKEQKQLNMLYLMHLSNDNSNSAEFVNRLQAITGRPVEVC